MSDLLPGAASAPAAPATPAVSPATPPSPEHAEWLAQADAETRGYFANRGWDKLTPAEAALKAAEGHRQAERYIGAPADKLIRVADPTDPAAVRAMWEKLGAPGDATKYDFSSVKVGDKGLDPKLASTLATAFNEANVPLTAAQQVAAALVKQSTDAELAKTAEQAAVLASNKADLAAKWGQNGDANLFVAKSAAAKLGVTAEAVAALEGQVGYVALMEMFRQIGQNMGEARFITNNIPGSEPSVYTADQALAKIAELKSDSDWAKRYTSGDKNAFNQMQRLIEQASGGRFADVRG